MNKVAALLCVPERYLEVDGDGEGLPPLSLRHVAAVLPSSVLLQFLLALEHYELLLQAHLVLAEVVLAPEVPCHNIAHISKFSTLCSRG